MKLKSKLLYFESKIIYRLIVIASFVFHKLSDKHRKIYLKIMEMEGEEE